MTYKAEYSDDEIEVFEAPNDDIAYTHADRVRRDEGVVLYNIFEVDENYDEIRTVF